MDFNINFSASRLRHSFTRKSGSGRNLGFQPLPLNIMKPETRYFHYFCAFAVASLAILFRLLCVFDMELTEALEYLGTLTLLTLSFIACSCVFGKLLETILKNNS